MNIEVTKDLEIVENIMIIETTELIESLDKIRITVGDASMMIIQGIISDLDTIMIDFRVVTEYVVIPLLSH